MPKDKDVAIMLRNVSIRFRIPKEKKAGVLDRIVGFIGGKQFGYDELWALRNINLKVNRGETVGIIGENGSGKSTLLKIMAHVFVPTTGKCVVNGKVAQFLELGVGFEPELTGRENVYLYGAIMGLKKKDIEARFDDIIKFAELEKFVDVKVKNYSSGMYMRLAFATAVHVEPEILLVDEVLAVGDFEYQQKCYDKFNEFKEEGKTIAFVSHDLSAVRRFCDKTQLLKEGRCVAFGDTNEIIDKYVYGMDIGRKKTDIAGTEERKAYIKDVKFYDKFGNESNVFKSGDSMKIRIFYKADKKVENPVFGIGLYTDTGVYCYGTNTYQKKMPIKEIYGDGNVEIDIETIPLIQGKFLLTVAIHSEDHATRYDWLDKQFSFTIVKSTEDDGLICLSTKWGVH